MKVKLMQPLGVRRERFEEIGHRALVAARRTTIMRYQTVEVYGGGDGVCEGLFCPCGHALITTVRVGYNRQTVIRALAGNTVYWIDGLTPLQRWALVLVHAAEHAYCCKTRFEFMRTASKPHREGLADNAVVCAAIKLHWGVVTKYDTRASI